MEKNNFCKNFQRIVNERNLSLAEVSKMTGLSIETIKNIYYQKIKDSKSKTVIAIARGLNISIDLLVKGKEREDNELLALYDSCSENGKERIFIISQILADITELNIKTKKNYIPYIIPIKDFSSINILAIDTKSTNAFFAIETKNSKLFPKEFNEKILLFTNKIPKENEFVLFHIKGKNYFRKFKKDVYGKFILKSLNEKDFDIEINKLEEINIIGTYLGEQLNNDESEEINSTDINYVIDMSDRAYIFN